MRFLSLLMLVIFSGCAEGDFGGESSLGALSDMGIPEGGECRPSDRRCIGATKTQACSDNGQWSVPTSCVNGVCEDGICIRSCEESCTPGMARCAPEGVQTCERDANGCGVWQNPKPCEAGTECSLGRCEREQCRSQCVAGTRRCIGANGYSECVQNGECAVWSAGMDCPAGQSCSAGMCQQAGSSCQDTCEDGTVTCLDDVQFQRCTRQQTGCLDLAAPERCPNNQICDLRQGCVSACQDNQCQLGDERCFQGGIQACVQDRRGCSVWGAIRQCAAGQSCQDNRCVESCQDECVVGDRRCDGVGFQACESVNGCGQWGRLQNCQPGLQCSGEGICRDSCRPGDAEQRECGDCGFEFRDCVNGEWADWSECIEAGQCAPGDVRECGNCGTQICNDACQWPQACEGQGECSAGTVESCGECGQRRCGVQCVWGQCDNSNERWRRCNDCGWEFCCPRGDWCNDCTRNLQFADDCGEFGMCMPDGSCRIMI